MYGFLLSVHIGVCLLLILIVLLQAGRGAGLAVFGSSGDAVFATPSGSSFLKKFTAVLAGTFAVTSLMLTLLSGRAGNQSVTRNKYEVPLASQTAPAAQPQDAATPKAQPTQTPAPSPEPAKK
ncbi:MAG: preprotein translocase subunit SecG [Elusimicrobiota bacterium]|jgi:preprotein translocase subunit SecG